MTTQNNQVIQKEMEGRFLIAQLHIDQKVARLEGIERGIKFEQADLNSQVEKGNFKWAGYSAEKIAKAAIEYAELEKQIEELQMLLKFMKEGNE